MIRDRNANRAFVGMLLLTVAACSEADPLMEPNREQRPAYDVNGGYADAEDWESSAWDNSATDPSGAASICPRNIVVATRVKLRLTLSMAPWFNYSRPARR